MNFTPSMVGLAWHQPFITVGPSSWVISVAFISNFLFFILPISDLPHSFSLNMISWLILSRRCIVVTSTCTSLTWKSILWSSLKARSTFWIWPLNSTPPLNISANPNGEMSTFHHRSAGTRFLVSDERQHYFRRWLYCSINWQVGPRGLEVYF